MRDKILLTDEELEPIYNKCVEDNHINGFAHAVAKAQLDKIPPEIWEILEKIPVCPGCNGLKFILTSTKLPLTQNNVVCYVCNGTGKDFSRLAILADNQLERLDGMKEEVARILCNKANPMMWDGEEHSFWDEKASESYKIGYYFIADEILASIRKVLE